jgi:hypothetical protein
MTPLDMGFLLFSQTMLLMAVALYGLPRVNPIAPGFEWHGGSKRRLYWGIFHGLRAAAVGVLTTLLVGDWGGWPLGAAMLGVCIVVSVLRARLPLKYRAELEVTTLGIVATTAHWLIPARKLNAYWAKTWSPLSNGNGAAWVVSLSLLIVLMQGGTYIVRGILERGGTKPTDETTVNQTVYKHGRMIGMVERLILAALVANGQYTAVAFFFAGKGLIRSKDLESRVWADYLLLGSLVSFLVALVVDLAISKLFAG